MAPGNDSCAIADEGEYEGFAARADGGLEFVQVRSSLVGGPVHSKLGLRVGQGDGRRFRVRVMANRLSSFVHIG